MTILRYLCYFIIILYSQKGVCFDTSGSWIDIPTAPFVSSLTNEHDELTSLIKQYHAINKVNLTLLSKRIDFLEKIHQKILKISNSAPQHLKNKLVKLDTIVEKKSWYLSQIQVLYNNASPYHEFLEIEYRNEPYMHLPLINKVFFDFKLPIYWGLYWLEVLDPCHRFLTGHYLKWKELNSSIPFFLWLEEQEIPYNAIQVEYFDQEKIEKNKIKILNGLFVHDPSLKPVQYAEANKEYLFVINFNKQLIVIEGSEKIRHTSITHGKPVLGAGAIKIQNGKLIYIDTESGHYQPTPDALWQVIRIFREGGANLDYDTIKVKYYKDDNMVFENASNFIKSYEQESLEFKI